MRSESPRTPIHAGIMWCKYIHSCVFPLSGEKLCFCDLWCDKTRTTMMKLVKTCLVLSFKTVRHPHMTVFPRRHDWISPFDSNIKLLWQPDSYFSEAEADPGLSSWFWGLSNSITELRWPLFTSERSHAACLLVLKSPGFLHFLERVMLSLTWPRPISFFFILKEICNNLHLICRPL